MAKSASGAFHADERLSRDSPHGPPRSAASQRHNQGSLRALASDSPATPAAGSRHAGHAHAAPTPPTQSSLHSGPAAEPPAKRPVPVEELDPFAQELKRLRAEEFKQHTDLRRIEFELLRVGWDVERFERQIETINAELEEHDKAMAASAAVAAGPIAAQ